MSNKQLRIELLGDFDETIQQGTDFSNVQFTTNKQIHEYGGIEHALYSIFDHNVLEDMEGYRVYNFEGQLEYIDDFCDFESIERIVNYSQEDFDLIVEQVKEEYPNASTKEIFKLACQIYEDTYDYEVPEQVLNKSYLKLVY